MIAATVTHPIEVDAVLVLVAVLASVAVVTAIAFLDDAAYHRWGDRFTGRKLTDDELAELEEAGQ